MKNSRKEVSRRVVMDSNIRQESGKNAMAVV